MRRIRTRKKARIRNYIERGITMLLMIIAIVVGGWEFMAWYFTMQIPNWLFCIGMISAVGLFLICCVYLDILIKDSSRFWDREEF